MQPHLPQPPPLIVPTICHQCLLDRQRQLSEQFDQPVLIYLTIVYDGYFTLRLLTPEGEEGLAEGFDFEEVVADAVAMLLGMRMLETSMHSPSDGP